VWSVSLSLVLAPLRILEFIDGESPLTGFHEVCHPINLGALNVILVTSANGHIGKEVLNVLRSSGMKAPAFVRKAEQEQEDQSGVLECRRAVTSAEQQ
jgi:hypothetical protein